MNPPDPLNTLADQLTAHLQRLLTPPWPDSDHIEQARTCWTDGLDALTNPIHLQSPPQVVARIARILADRFDPHTHSPWTLLHHIQLAFDIKDRRKLPISERLASTVAALWLSRDAALRERVLGQGPSDAEPFGGHWYTRCTLCEAIQSIDLEPDLFARFAHQLETAAPHGMIGGELSERIGDWALRHDKPAWSVVGGWLQRIHPPTALHAHTVCILIRATIQAFSASPNPPGETDTPPLWMRRRDRLLNLLVYDHDPERRALVPALLMTAWPQDHTPTLPERHEALVAFVRAVPSPNSITACFEALGHDVMLDPEGAIRTMDALMVIGPQMTPSTAQQTLMIALRINAHILNHAEPDIALAVLALPSWHRLLGHITSELHAQLPDDPQHILDSLDQLLHACVKHDPSIASHLFERWLIHHIQDIQAHPDAFLDALSPSHNAIAQRSGAPHPTHNTLLGWSLARMAYTHSDSAHGADATDILRGICGVLASTLLSRDPSATLCWPPLSDAQARVLAHEIAVQLPWRAAWLPILSQLAIQRAEVVDDVSAILIQDAALDWRDSCREALDAWSDDALLAFSLTPEHTRALQTQRARVLEHIQTLERSTKTIDRLPEVHALRPGLRIWKQLEHHQHLRMHARARAQSKLLSIFPTTPLRRGSTLFVLRPGSDEPTETKMRSVEYSGLFPFRARLDAHSTEQRRQYHAKRAQFFARSAVEPKTDPSS